MYHYDCFFLCAKICIKAKVRIASDNLNANCVVKMRVSCYLIRFFFNFVFVLYFICHSLQN
jgi:hypothetical protein